MWQEKNIWQAADGKRHVVLNDGPFMLVMLCAFLCDSAGWTKVAAHFISPAGLTGCGVYMLLNRKRVSDGSEFT